MKTMYLKRQVFVGLTCLGLLSGAYILTKKELPPLENKPTVLENKLQEAFREIELHPEQEPLLYAKCCEYIQYTIDVDSQQGNYWLHESFQAIQKHGYSFSNSNKKDMISYVIAAAEQEPTLTDFFGPVAAAYQKKKVLGSYLQQENNPAAVSLDPLRKNIVKGEEK